MTGGVTWPDFMRLVFFLFLQHGTYQFHADAWSSISATAKNFIKRLLVRNPQERMSAAEVCFSMDISDRSLNSGLIGWLVGWLID